MVYDESANVQCFEKSDFYIVNMDSDMPEMNGIEALSVSNPIGSI
jgi:CheY-like chemotaxis protein